MYDDVYLFLQKLIREHGKKEFPVKEITGVEQGLIPAVQELIDREYLFANRFFPTAYVTRSGIRAYKQEWLRRKDELHKQEQQEAQKNAERISERSYADEDTKKHFRHDWRIAVFETVIGFILGAVVDYSVDIVGNAVRLVQPLLERFQSLLPP